MKLILNRIYKSNSYTIGNLLIDGVYFCDTLEDKDRGLTSNMSLSDIAKIKVSSETAIPTGIYKITLDVVSPKYKDRTAYKSIGGKLPRLIGVPGYDGVLIHIGNTDKDSSGCILVGENKVKGQVINSTVTFNRLYKLLERAKSRGEDITIQIN